MTDQQKQLNWFKRHKILTGLLAFILLIFILEAIGGKNQNTPTTTASTNTAANTKTSSKATTTTTQATDNTPGLNQQANDGKLGFTVTSIQCGLKEIDQQSDTDGLESTTQGSPYCEMNLTVKGVSTVAQDFDDDAQYIYSANGTQYSVDDDATIDANDASSNCMEDPTVNPGTTITCTLAFDVPSGVTPTYAMLHDSELSGGVKVELQ
jgi:hypothetical protein